MRSALINVALLVFIYLAVDTGAVLIISSRANTTFESSVRPVSSEPERERVEEEHDKSSLKIMFIGSVAAVFVLGISRINLSAPSQSGRQKSDEEFMKEAAELLQNADDQTGV